ncbi:MAG: MBL fold metallo-hydrolase [Trueperaceae bacterium]
MSKDSKFLHLWWLGQSGFLIQYQNNHLLLDPYLSDSLTKKYESTTKPHVRMTERVIAPERLDCIDVVTSSHNHTDHLDAETLLPLMQINPELKIIISKANLEFAANCLQISTERLTPITHGRESSRGVAGNLSGAEAAQLAKNISAKLVVPCHYNMFEFNTVSPDDFVNVAEKIGQPYYVLQNGERLSL